MIQLQKEEEEKQKQIHKQEKRKLKAEDIYSDDDSSSSSDGEESDKPEDDKRKGDDSDSDRSSRSSYSRSDSDREWVNYCPFAVLTCNLILWFTESLLHFDLISSGNPLELNSYLRRINWLKFGWVVIRWKGKFQMMHAS